MAISVAGSAGKFQHLTKPAVTMACEEGARTTTDGTIVDGSGATKRTHAWADAITKGNLLKMDATNSNALTVMNRTISDVDLVGIAHASPKQQNLDGLNWITSDATPPAEEQRTVSVQLFGDFTRMIEIDDGGTLPTLEQSVTPSGVAGGLHVWDRDTTRNDSFTLAVGTLGVQDTLVLFGYSGAF